MQDDPRKKATPPAKPHTARYKQGHKNSINKEGGKVCSKNLLFQDNAHKLSPLQALIQEEQERKPRKAKREPRLDPFMVRQAKLKAKQAQ